MQSWGHRSLPGSPTPAGYVLSRVWVDEGSVCKDGGHGGTHRESGGTHLKNKARKPILHRQIWDGKPNFENPTVFTTEINRLYYPQNWWLSVAVIMWSSDQNLEVFLLRMRSKYEARVSSSEILTHEVFSVLETMCHATRACGWDSWGLCHRWCQHRDEDKAGLSSQHHSSSKLLGKTTACLPSPQTFVKRATKKHT